MCRITGRHRKAGKRYSDHGGLSDKDPDVVEIGAIAGQPAGLQLAELRGRLGDRFFVLGDDEKGIAGGQDSIGCRNEVVSVLSNHGDLHVG